MMNRKYFSIWLFLIFFTVVANIPFSGIGATGLVIPRNNLAWIWISIVIGYALLQGSKTIIFPKNINLMVLGIFISTVPFLINYELTINEGYLLPLGLIAIFLFLLSILQYSIFQEKPYLLLILILITGFIQILYGTYQTTGALLVNHSMEKPIYDPASLGVFNQKNNFASFTASTLLISLYLTCFHANSFKVFGKNFNIINLSIAFLGGFLICFSSSRAGYLGVFLSVLFLLVPCYKQNKSKLYSWLASLLLGILISFATPNFDTNTKEYTNANARIDIYWTSLKLVQDSPLLGHGPGSFDKVFLKKYLELHKNDNLITNKSVINLSHPHNELLLWAIEGGLISAFGLMLLAFLIIFTLYKNKKLHLIALTTPIFIHTMVEHPFHISTLHLIAFTLIIGYLILFCKSTKATNFNFSQTIVKALSTLTITLSGYFLFNNLSSILKITTYLKAPVKNISDITDIDYTIGWKHQYNSILLGSKLQFAFRDKNSPDINYYITWAEKTFLEEPRIEYLQNIAKAYLYSGRLDQAEITVQRIINFYPNNRKLNLWIDAFRKDFNSIKKQINM